LNEKIENDGKKGLDVLDPLAACKLDAKRIEKETGAIFRASLPGETIF
jgi:hypothetical protein